MTERHIVDDLLLRLDFRDPDPQVIDLSPAGGVVSTLQEAKIECLSGDKVSLYIVCSFPKLRLDTISFFCRSGFISLLLPPSLPRQIPGISFLD